MQVCPNRSWAEIDLGCITHNLAEIRRRVGRRTEIMAVVKADAYGHGIMETVSAMLDGGASRLAVSMLDEAIQLRRSGIDVPILVLGFTDPRRAGEIIENHITQTVFSHDLSEALSAEAVARGTRARVHVKIDTGMTRVGFQPGYAAVKDVMRISNLPGIIVEGIFTHFASADEADLTYTRQQFELFDSMMTELNRIGVMIPIRHASNSAGIIAFPDATMEMVRPGVIMYGIWPSPWLRGKELDLRPAMSIKANVILVKHVEPDTSISYGRRFTTSRPSIIATIPIGYADGFPRAFTNRGRVLVGGHFAPVVGTVCMDQCMIDVTDLPFPVRVGDEVVLMGEQGERRITADEWAETVGTIAYETVCLVGKRMPRVYMRDGRIINVCNYLL